MRNTLDQLQSKENTSMMIRQSMIEFLREEPDPLLLSFATTSASWRFLTQSAVHLHQVSLLKLSSRTCHLLTSSLMEARLYTLSVVVLKRLVTKSCRALSIVKMLLKQTTLALLLFASLQRLKLRMARASFHSKEVPSLPCVQLPQLSSQLQADRSILPTTSFI